MYIGKDLHATFQRGILSAMGGIITNGCPGNSMDSMLGRKHSINSSIRKNILNFHAIVKSNLSLLLSLTTLAFSIKPLIIIASSLLLMILEISGICLN